MEGEFLEIITVVDEVSENFEVLCWIREESNDRTRTVGLDFRPLGASLNGSDIFTFWSTNIESLRDFLYRGDYIHLPGRQEILRKLNAGELAIIGMKLNRTTGELIL